MTEQPIPSLVDRFSDLAIAIESGAAVDMGALAAVHKQLHDALVVAAADHPEVRSLVADLVASAEARVASFNRNGSSYDLRKALASVERASALVTRAPPGAAPTESGTERSPYEVLGNITIVGLW